MARPINRKCQHCATLAVEEAIALHGSEGDDCWNPGDCRQLDYDCHRRRNHYRHRQDDNQTRRRMRKLHKQNQEAQYQEAQYQEGQAIATDRESIEFNPPPFPYAAVLVLYRQGKDAPVHAIAAEIWQGDRKVKQINAAHCMGMRGNEVTAYIREMLEHLHQQFGVSRFEDVIKEVAVHHCPIEGCPISQMSSTNPRASSEQ